MPPEVFPLLIIQDKTSFAKPRRFSSKRRSAATKSQEKGSSFHPCLSLCQAKARSSQLLVVLGLTDQSMINLEDPYQSRSSRTSLHQAEVRNISAMSGTTRLMQLASCCATSASSGLAMKLSCARRDVAVKQSSRNMFQNNNIQQPLQTISNINGSWGSAPLCHGCAAGRPGRLKHFTLALRKALSLRLGTNKT